MATVETPRYIAKLRILRNDAKAKWAASAKALKAARALERALEHPDYKGSTTNGWTWGSHVRETIAGLVREVAAFTEDCQRYQKELDEARRVK